MGWHAGVYIGVGPHEVFCFDVVLWGVFWVCIYAVLRNGFLYSGSQSVTSGWGWLLLQLASLQRGTTMLSMSCYK